MVESKWWRVKGCQASAYTVETMDIMGVTHYGYISMYVYLKWYLKWYLYHGNVYLSCVSPP